MAIQCNTAETENRTSVCGTPTYQSPEMVQAEEFDSKTDCWSFAVTIYEIFCEKKLISSRTNKNQRLEMMRTIKTHVVE